MAKPIGELIENVRIARAALSAARSKCLELSALKRAADTASEKAADAVMFAEDELLSFARTGQ